MSVYLISCGLSILTMHIGSYYGGKQVNKWVLAFFSALPMILVAAFRYGVGVDYLLTYKSYFDMVETGMLQQKDKMELIYHYLNVVTSALNGDFFIVTAFCAVLFYLFVYGFLVEASPSPCLSIFLLTGMGFVFVAFNAMRQMVGCAIIFYALRYVKERRFWPFAALVAVAAGFHSSCVLFLPVYLFPKIKIRPWLAFLLSAVVIAFGNTITWVALNFISQTRYGIYIASIFDTGKTAWVMLLINLILLAFLSVVYSDNENYQLYYNLQLVSVWIIYFSGRIVLSLRLLWMFGLPSIISLPMALERIPRERDRKLCTGVVVLLYLAYTLYTVGLQNSNGVLPYRTIFGEWMA